MISAFETANEKGTLRVVASFDNVTKPGSRARASTRRSSRAAAGALGAQGPGRAQGAQGLGFTQTSDDEYQMVREGMKVADEFEGKRPGS
jgi:hypothetical protein